MFLQLADNMVTSLFLSDISDPVPQISKTTATTLEADQSIDEILGLEVLCGVRLVVCGCVPFSLSGDGRPSLQGEIHMSDDAIHDILEQTESDPAFQALYDLFDYSNYSLCYFCAVVYGSAVEL